MPNRETPGAETGQHPTKTSSVSRSRSRHVARLAVGFLMLGLAGLIGGSATAQGTGFPAPTPGQIGPPATDIGCADCPSQLLPGAGINWQDGSGAPRPVLPCTELQAPGPRSFRGNLWPGGVVPYAFDTNVNQSEQSAVLAAMQEWENVAPITFVPWTGQNDRILIRDANSNSSFVGRIGGQQTINIFNFNVRMIIAHELCHALGFFHTQSRPDRNTFVTIQTANVVPGALNNFSIASGSNTFGLPYDFLSIMHYGDFDFSANGQPTIICNPGFTQFQSQIGQRSALSQGDINMMQAAYGPILAPQITGLSPSSGQSYLPPRVSLFGTDLDTVDQVLVGGQSAVFTIVSDSQLDLTPPGPSTIGPTTIEVVNNAGTSNSVTYTVTGNDPAQVAGTSFLFPGLVLPFRCHTDAGKGAVLFASIFNGPSIAPNVINLDIGSSFSYLLEVGPAAFADATGTVNWQVQVPSAGVPSGLTIYFQAALFDPGNVTYPLSVSQNVFTALTL